MASYRRRQARALKAAKEDIKEVLNIYRAVQTKYYLHNAVKEKMKLLEEEIEFCLKQPNLLNMHSTLQEHQDRHWWQLDLYFNDARGWWRYGKFALMMIQLEISQAMERDDVVYESPPYTIHKPKHDPDPDAPSDDVKGDPEAIWFAFERDMPCGICKKVLEKKSYVKLMESGRRDPIEYPCVLQKNILLEPRHRCREIVICSPRCEEIKIGQEHKALRMKGKRVRGPNANVFCDSCFKRMDKKRKCSKCKFAYYCSSECQTNDWEEHKRVCKELRNRPPTPPPEDKMDLLMRIITGGDEEQVDRADSSGDESEEQNLPSNTKSEECQSKSATANNTNSEDKGRDDSEDNVEGATGGIPSTHVVVNSMEEID